MRTDLLKSSAGFIFVAALFIVIVMGIMLGATAQSWQMAMKRDREEELLFRGGQILNAIEKWRKPATVAPGQAPQQPMPIKDLKDLVEDPSAQKRHLLRKVYLDPMTNKDFAVIKGTGGGIIGVASTSKEKPVKISFQNMSGVYKTFDGKEKYSDWKFVPKALQGQIPSQTTITGGLPVGQP